MELARRVGLDVAAVSLTKANGKDVLLVERFDRAPGSRKRRAVVSALTILGLSELTPRYASYANLAEDVRRRFTEPRETLRELFGRIVFNVLVGNTDDHARNHMAFWDGRDEMLTLTPAFDVCPYLRGGGEATQAMAIGPDGSRLSRVESCVAAASTYLLSEHEARAIVDHQVSVVEGEWEDVCDAAGLGVADRERFRRQAVLHPYAREGYAVTEA
jgi:serine/threonine-protein kinase HipA